VLQRYIGTLADLFVNIKKYQHSGWVKDSLGGLVDVHSISNSTAIRSENNESWHFLHAYLFRIMLFPHVPWQIVLYRDLSKNKGETHPWWQGAKHWRISSHHLSLSWIKGLTNYPQTDIKLLGVPTRDQRTHLPASLPKAVARGGYGGSAELALHRLTCYLHMAAPKFFPNAVLHACTCFTGQELPYQDYKYEGRGSKWRHTTSCSFSQSSLV
jgi:hypothetical protein